MFITLEIRGLVIIYRLGRVGNAFSFVKGGVGLINRFGDEWEGRPLPLGFDKKRKEIYAHESLMVKIWVIYSQSATKSDHFQPF